MTEDKADMLQHNSLFSSKTLTLLDDETAPFNRKRNTMIIFELATFWILHSLPTCSLNTSSDMSNGGIRPSQVL